MVIRPSGHNCLCYLDGARIITKFLYSKRQLQKRKMKSLESALILSILLLVGFTSSSSALSQGTDGRFCVNNPLTQACQYESAFLLSGKNTTSTILPPLGSLAGAPSHNITATITSAGIQSQPLSPNNILNLPPTALSAVPYAGVAGCEASCSHNYLNSVGTTIQFYDFANPKSPGKSLGSSVVSGGMYIHLDDSAWGVDYQFQFTAYFSSAGYANVAYAFYSACDGIPTTNCGPPYPCIPFVAPWLPADCVGAYYKGSSGSLSGVGLAGDPIGLGIYWNTRVQGYVFNYQDLNNNKYW